MKPKQGKRMWIIILNWNNILKRWFWTTFALKLCYLEALSAQLNNIKLIKPERYQLDLTTEQLQILDTDGNNSVQ